MKSFPAFLLSVFISFIKDIFFRAKNFVLFTNKFLLKHNSYGEWAGIFCIALLCIHLLVFSISKINSNTYAPIIEKFPKIESIAKNLTGKTSEIKLPEIKVPELKAAEVFTSKAPVPEIKIVEPQKVVSQVQKKAQPELQKTQPVQVMPPQVTASPAKQYRNLEAEYSENLEAKLKESLNKNLNESLNKNLNELNTFRDILTQNSIPYNESASASLHDKIKQVDNALIQAVLRLNIPLDNFQVENSYIRMKGESYFIFQKIRLNLPSSISIAQWNTALAEILELWAHNSYLSNSAESKVTTIYINSQVTHEIYYSPPKSSAKLSIVIDDLGGYMKNLFSLLALDYPVTFSILPDTRYSKVFATIAHHAKREVILHQPMEARTPIFTVPIGLNVDDNILEIKKKLEENLKNVPYASGINNHTGSKFTENFEAVQKFLIALKLVNPFLHVLDSHTTAHSKLEELARSVHFRTAKRSVFLDNIREKEEIEKQLNYALELALKNPTKHVIAIGHPNISTLEVLRDWKAYKRKNVEIIHVFP